MSSDWATAAIDTACVRAEEWLRELPDFPGRVNLGSVVGFRQPGIISEQDCVMQFARFLSEAGVPWDAMHHQVSCSRWLFDQPHPVATAEGERWSVDLALLRCEDFLAANLPALAVGFKFDAFLEFTYLGDSWTLPGAAKWGQPNKGRKKVAQDIEKSRRYLENGACRAAYVIVFEACDFDFPPGFSADAEADSGCKVRFVRGHRS